MRRRSLRLWFSIVVAGFVLFSFQNCGGGFESAAPLDPVAVASPTATEDVLEEQGTVPAKVLLTNPVVASGNLNFAFDGDYSEFLTNRLLFEPLPNLTYLATEHFKISTDDEYPNQLARPAPSLEFMPSDPEFLQVNVFFHLQRFTRVLQRLQIFPSNFIADLDVNAQCPPQRPLPTYTEPHLNCCRPTEYPQARE